MKINPDSMRPDDPEAKRGSALTTHLTVVTVVGMAAIRRGNERELWIDPVPEPMSELKTLTERVLIFLDERAA